MRWRRLAYGLLLLAFPRRVRHEFGDEMRRLFDDQWREAGSARGRLSLALAATADALRHGFGERVQPMQAALSRVWRGGRRWRWWMQAPSGTTSSTRCACSRGSAA